MIIKAKKATKTVVTQALAPLKRELQTNETQAKDYLWMPQQTSTTRNKPYIILFVYSLLFNYMSK